MKIVPGKEPQISTFGGPLRTGAHRSDGKYKYLGAANGGDGKVYLFPSDTDYVLQIDPENDTCREVGPNLREIEHIHHNKWQNGFTSKCKTAIYGIPLKGSSVLRYVLLHQMIQIHEKLFSRVWFLLVKDLDEREGQGPRCSRYWRTIQWLEPLGRGCHERQR